MPAFAGDVRDFLFWRRHRSGSASRPDRDWLMETARLEAIGKPWHLDADSDGRLTIAEANRVEWPRFFLMLHLGPFPGSLASAWLLDESPDAA
jgi:hypothetical protein